MIDDDRSNAERVKMSGEYLETLGKYNAAARQFSQAVKPFQEVDNRPDCGFTEKFWERFEKKRTSSLKKAYELKSLEFKYEPFQPLKKEFVSFAEKMETYFFAVENMRRTVDEWTPEKKSELFAVLDPLYDEILKQSEEITIQIDMIYNRVFVVGENASL